MGAIIKFFSGLSCIRMLEKPVRSPQSVRASRVVYILLHGHGSRHNRGRSFIYHKPSSPISKRSSLEILIERLSENAFAHADPASQRHLNRALAGLRIEPRNHGATVTTESPDTPYIIGRQRRFSTHDRQGSRQQKLRGYLSCFAGPARLRGVLLRVHVLCTWITRLICVSPGVVVTSRGLSLFGSRSYPTKKAIPAGMFPKASTLSGMSMRSERDASMPSL